MEVNSFFSVFSKATGEQDECGQGAPAWEVLLPFESLMDSGMGPGKRGPGASCQAYLS